MKTLLSFLISLSLLFPVQGQDTPEKPFLFITDASGSMWQKVDNEFKITIARDVLGEMIDGMNPNTQMGLVAYGHRAKGDCNDIEELLPLTNTDKEAFKAALEKLNPLGKTPLARSARQVIEKLKKENASATIILITDGIETCDGDLCQVVKEAKAEGIDFVMHIIGFDLGDADRAPLDCAARAGDGKYFDASDREQLSEALKETSQLTEEEIPDGRLSVKSIRNDELADAAIMIYKEGTKDDIDGLRTYNDPSTNPAIFKIAEGTYDIGASLVGKRGVSDQMMKGVRVSSTDTNSIVFDFSSGVLELLVTEKAELHDAAVKVRVHGSREEATAGRTYVSSSSNPLTKELSPGVYDIDIGSVSIKGGSAKITLDSIVIKARETTSLAHEFQSAILEVKTTAGGTLCDASVNIRDAGTGESAGGGRTYGRPESNPKSFLLSPGTYELDIRGIKVNGDPREKITVTLKPGETLLKSISW